MKSWLLHNARHRKTIKRFVVLGMAALLCAIAFNPWIDTDKKDFIGDLQILAVGAVLIAFCALYVTRSKWRLHVAGRALLYMAGTFAFFVVWISFSTFFGRDWFPCWSEVRVVVYGSVFLSAFNMLWTLWEIQSGLLDREPEDLQDQTFKHK